MILYLDTSALIKLYIDETSSPKVLQAVSKSEVVATCTLSFVEAHATFARLEREKKLNASDYLHLKKIFAENWKDYLQIENSYPVMQQAADFAESFSLRGYDAMQLAAAHFLLTQQQPVLFACFDHKLNQAAKILGFLLI
jgi:predicted nucleic acid-binding protein